MSLFRSNGLFSNIIGSPKIENAFLEKIRQETRSKIEDVAENINPELGKVVRKTNNFIDTINNAKDGGLIVDPEDLNSNRLIKKIFEEDIVENNLVKSDHIYTYGMGYSHHGIFIGNSQVIHYSLDEEMKSASIRIDSFETFKNGRKVMRKNNNESPANYSTEKIVMRAYSRLGENAYTLFSNNCENFVRWCRNGGTEY